MTATTTTVQRRHARATRSQNPWRALWAMMVGFFMILLDSTIVAVANPRIMEKLNTDYNAVIWVTSAYLLAYAVPLLVAGRLGDRFGPKNLYMAGLAVFTGASLWCGLAGSVEMLITARIVQGLGAAVLTPQTLSTITRIFPAERRGVAMGVWGATAGVATLVGPLAGGVLVDGLGWQWIFFVNVPIGVLGVGLAVWLIPVLPTHRHQFDLVGVLLSGIAMFLLVFGLQEGQSHDWVPWIWAMIAGGVFVMAVFVYWQSINNNEPLIPLEIFGDRNFSLSNVGIAVMGFAAVALILPMMFYLQAVCGLSPTRSALLSAPMAVTTGLLAPAVGKIVDRSHPRTVVGFGFSALAIALTWLSFEMTPTTPIWRLVLPFIGMGVGMSFIWSPLAATATRNLPPQLAGAGSGVYNTTRQVGSVLGSASMAAFMTARISNEMPPMPADMPQGRGSVTQLPNFLHAPFSAAMSQSMLLPAFVALFGVVAAMFLVGSRGTAPWRKRSRAAAYSDPRTEVLPIISAAETSGFDDYDRDYDPDYGRDYDHDSDDAYGEDYEDDDDYAEYIVSRPVPMGDDSDTEPMDTRVEPTRAERVNLSPTRSVETLRNDPLDTWLREPEEPLSMWLEDPLESKRRPSVEPIGFAHNGFHVDHDKRFRDLGDRPPSTGAHVVDSGSSGSSGEPRGPRHQREDDPDDYGRHAMPNWD